MRIPSADNNLRCATGLLSTRQTPDSRCGLTLVEMLIAMSITLLMMAAVVTVFANVSDSIRNRRASIEVASQVRHVREVLQRDLAAATCPAQPTQRPESNHGYIELIEGPQSDFDPSIWLRDVDNNGQPEDVDGSGPLPRLDLAASSLPSSTQLTLPGASNAVTTSDAQAVTDGRGLGDWDDILAFTARNENEPYVGRIPSNTGAAFVNWTSETIESPLAEVVWFAVENPIEDSANPTFYFGEPGFRTIYRRTLLIAPQLNFAFNIGGQTTGPGVVRVLGNSVDIDEVDQALAALIAFQERYDLSVRLEWDPLLGGGRWTIVANSLSDLTKRENRYEHYGFSAPANPRSFPFAATLLGGAGNLQFIIDPELSGVPDQDDAGGSAAANGVFTISDRGNYQNAERPFVFVNGSATTARAIVNEDGQVVAVTNGYAPLGGARRGQDIMLTDVLAFDMRVYDPEAPLLAEDPRPTIGSDRNPNFPGAAIEPGDAGWGFVVTHGDADLNNDGSAFASLQPLVIGRGAYVDLGYWSLHRAIINNNARFNLKLPNPTPPSSLDLVGNPFADTPASRSQLAPNTTAGAPFEPYRTYDTWSFHYENNGIDEDNRDNDADTTTGIDEGTNGLDDRDPSLAGNPLFVDTPDDIAILGPDDPGELETSPPYNAPLRGVQVTLRAYERDSRQVREVKVRQTFVPQ